MNLVIISGFLGTGKTTLLLSIAKSFSAQGKKLVILENEVGKVGVDDETLKLEGLNVREIYSGCICCSLRTDLISTLLEIERDIKPNVVILEPSGVANPELVLKALQGYGGEINNKIILSIIDASRFEKILNMSMPLVTSGIKVADLIVINKCDLIDESQLPVIHSRILDYKNDVKFLSTSALTGMGVGELFDALTLINDEDHEDEALLDTSIDKKGPKPSVFSKKINFEIPDSPDEFSKFLFDAIEQAAEDLRNSGCTLIGHIKAIAKCDGGGYLVVGKTDFDHPAQIKGRLSKSATSLSITINAIVYDLSTDTVSKVILKQFPLLRETS